MIKNKMKNPLVAKIAKVSKHPYATFIYFGLATVVLLLLQMFTPLIKYSFVGALAQTMCYAIVAVGFSYLLGYAGLSSLGTAGFVGLGSYITVYMLRTYSGMNYFVVMLIVLVVSIIIGLIVGFISLRIEGIFLAIVTLGLSEVFYQVFMNATEFTGGSNGTSFTGEVNIFPGISLGREGVFIMIAVFLTAMIIMTFNLVNSPTGRAMLAMKNSTSAAQAMGISLLKYRLLAFILATIYAAIAGSLLMTFNKYTDPKSWTIMFSLNILAACLLGGTRSIWGIFIGTFFVFGLTPMFLNDIVFLRNNPWLLSTIIGVVLILVLMFYKGGLMQLLHDIKKFVNNKISKRREFKYGKDEI